MATATLGGLDVLNAVARMPLQGEWRVRAQLATGETPKGRVLFDTPGAKLSGTLSGGKFLERSFVELVAGAGKLEEDIDARGYRDVEARTLLIDALRLAGDTLDGASSAALLAQRYAFWTRLGRPASDELDSIADALGATWRLTDSGAVLVLVDTWPTMTFDARVLGDEPELKRATIASDEPTLRPGVTFNGRRVTYVEHQFTEQGTRTVYCYE